MTGEQGEELYFEWLSQTLQDGTQLRLTTEQEQGLKNKLYAFYKRHQDAYDFLCTPWMDAN